jgi:hypothetical protein
MGILAQLFGGMTQVWLNVAFIVCIFGVLAWKPERIVNFTSFRAACLLFALSILAPSFGVFVLDTATDVGGARGRSAFGEITTTMKIFNLLPPLFFACAFLAAISSLLPSRETKPTPPPADNQSLASP